MLLTFLQSLLFHSTWSSETGGRTPAGNVVQCCMEKDKFISLIKYSYYIVSSIFFNTYIIWVYLFSNLFGTVSRIFFSASACRCWNTSIILNREWVAVASMKTQQFPQFFYHRDNRGESFPVRQTYRMHREVGHCLGQLWFDGLYRCAITFT